MIILVLSELLGLIPTIRVLLPQFSRRLFQSAASPMVGADITSLLSKHAYLFEEELVRQCDRSLEDGVDLVQAVSRHRAHHVDHQISLAHALHNAFTHTSKQQSANTKEQS